LIHINALGTASGHIFRIADHRFIREVLLMTTLMPWTSVEIGDLDVFAPALPSLVVYTWYVDGEPESTVTYFWQDEDTGMVHHELLFMEPVTFEEALAWAEQHAPKRKIKRIHVKHTRSPKPASGKTAAKPPAKLHAARRKRHGAGKRQTAKAGKRGRKRARAAA
jgi:hypothetical protein